jgi:hypothetical protein
MLNAASIAMPAPETIAQYDAQRRLKSAQAAFSQALEQLREATHAEMRATLALMDQGERGRYLRRVVRSNSAGWSGGPYTDTNLREAITREIHLQQLVHSSQ